MAITKIKPSNTSEPSIGLDARARKDVVKALSLALSDTYLLQLKTQFYHWNVTGSLFASLHGLFGAQYDELSEAVDELAERIRALGHTSPGTFREFLEMSSLKEDKALPEDWQTMIKNLLAAHEAVIRSLRAAQQVAAKAGDEGSADLFIGRLQAHEKASWMLRSHLQ